MKKKVIVGQFNKHIRGFGFVKTDIADLPEIFIAKQSTKGAMHQDMVEVDIIPGYLWGERPEGIVTKIIQRATTTVIGTLQAHKGFGFVVSDDKNIKDDIFIKREKFLNAKNGDKVVAKITSYPTKKTKAEGEIIEVIARADDTDGHIKALIRAKGLTEEFPPEVLAQTKMYTHTILDGDNVIISDEEIGRRIDLREKQIVTIDGNGQL